MSGFNSFKNISTWIFDLDNTLYHPRKKIFDMIHKRMTRFIANYFEINLKEARKIQTKYFYKYGTTLSGLMKKHNIKPNVFLNYVHDINFDKFEKHHKDLIIFFIERLKNYMKEKDIRSDIIEAAINSYGIDNIIKVYKKNN